MSQPQTQLSLWPDASFDGTRTRMLQQDSYAIYRGTPQWKARVVGMKQLQKYRCANCQRETPLHIHHRHYRTVRNEFPSDLVGLCERCHHRSHDDWA
jgi:5-methylcytosine-specific restriction endonuclease McrA